MAGEVIKTVIGLSFVTRITACGGSGSDTSTDDASATIAGELTSQASLGKKIFMDQTLSASGRMSCATCHDPSNAFAQTNNRAVQLGGLHLNVPGFRAVPSLRYLNLTTAFHFDKEGKPTGGFARDGRADTLANQASTPFLAPHEMANVDKATVVAELQLASYADQFRQVYGAAIFSNPDDAFDRILFSLQQYQKEDRDFHPYDSKYDFFLAGKVRLSDAELRGLALFNNPAKGNCASCHISTKSPNGDPPLFTDFTYDNLGVPRNFAIPATADANYFDFGLCGPDRQDLAARTDLCGAFKVPTLRNVATRKVFFHNGRFTTLRDTLSFYVRRYTNPDEWYPVVFGNVLKFNDLPAPYVRNVNTIEAPYNRTLGMTPALSSSEIDDLISFLGTLTDGYQH